MAGHKQEAATPGRLAALGAWIDARFPMTKLWNEQAAQYYAPKNFNLWYYFCSLALLVLVLQIVTGIFLTMRYKRSAADVFGSVEYIMRDVEWPSVKEHGINLLFASTRRDDIQKRFFVRTHAREFMMKLPCSVAMVRVVEMGRKHPRNILVPLKGHLSQLEERAYFTAKLAQGLNARTTLLLTFPAP